MVINDPDGAIVAVAEVKFATELVIGATTEAEDGFVPGAGGTTGPPAHGTVNKVTRTHSAPTA